jgi:uncharacterized membrane protein YfcA
VIHDPWFYFAAVPAVLMFGISKGGFGVGIGIVAVPLMALVISPVQAAAILLPILCLMDLFALRAYWGRWVWSEVRLLVPASLIGIGTGTMLFEFMSPAVIRLVLGAVTIAFTLRARVVPSRAGCDCRRHGRIYELHRPCGWTAPEHVFVAEKARPNLVRRYDRRFFRNG